MLSIELNDLIKQIIKTKAESQTIEVKAAHKGTPKRLYDTLSSFSNQDSGGIIVFGLDESLGFEPVGVYDLQDLQKKVTEQCNQMEPVVRAIFTTTEYKGVNICSAEIPSIDITNRPCYYRGAGKTKGSYVRVGDADLPMTDYEIYSFESYKAHVHDDERPINRANISLLDEAGINNYILQMKLNRPYFSKLSEEQIYELLSITRNGVPTLASVLNFGIYPQGLLPQLAITATVIPGTGIGETTNDGVRFLDNKRIEGTLSEMLDEAIAFCNRNMRTQTIIDPTTGKRNDKTEYPINAIREAILNALIHRDYSIHTEGMPIQLIMFEDRIEIHNPGGLYGRITIDQLGKIQPDTRNPVLASALETLGITENRYSGIPTIRMEMEKYNLRQPEFLDERGSFIVKLYKESKNDYEDMSNDEETNNLIVFCKTPRTRKEICDYLGLNSVTYAIQTYVNPLVEAGVIKLSIPDKPKSPKQLYYSVEREE